MGNPGSIPGSGRSTGERIGYSTGEVEYLSTLVFWPGEFHGLYREHD